MSEEKKPYEDIQLFAFIGEDELGSGAIGIKQGLVPAGYIPLVTVDKEKFLSKPYLLEALRDQARSYGKKIVLARFRFVDVVWETE